MAIDKSSTPATGARGRRQFPDGFHHGAQEELMRGITPVTTRPFCLAAAQYDARQAPPELAANADTPGETPILTLITTGSSPTKKPTKTKLSTHSIP